MKFLLIYLLDKMPLITYYINIYFWYVTYLLALAAKQLDSNKQYKKQQNRDWSRKDSSSSSCQGLVSVIALQLMHVLQQYMCF